VGGVAAARKATSGSFRARGAAAITAPQIVSGKDTKGFAAGADRALKDLVNFPAQALPSAYVPAAGLVEAAQGRPQRIKKFAKDFKQTDPVYNTGAALVEKAKGNDKAAASHLKKAGKSASEHPGFTALEAYGVKGTLGRALDVQGGRVSQARQASAPRPRTAPRRRAGHEPRPRSVPTALTSRRRPCRSSVTRPAPGVPGGSVRRRRPRSPLTLTRFSARRTRSTRPA
jgi:hypothetical protein